MFADEVQKSPPVEEFGRGPPTGAMALLTVVALWVAVSVPLALVAGRLLHATNPGLISEIDAYLRRGQRHRVRRALGMAATFVVLGGAVASATVATGRLPALRTVTDWAFDGDSPPPPSSTSVPTVESDGPDAAGPVDRTTARGDVAPVAEASTPEPSVLTEELDHVDELLADDEPVSDVVALVDVVPEPEPEPISPAPNAAHGSPAHAGPASAPAAQEAPPAEPVEATPEPEPEAAPEEPVDQTSPPPQAEAEAEATEPEPDESELLEPEPVEPEIVEPELVDPEVLEPEVLEPEPVVVEPVVEEPVFVAPEVRHPIPFPGFPSVDADAHHGAADVVAVDAEPTEPLETGN